VLDLSDFVDSEPKRARNMARPMTSHESRKPQTAQPMIRGAVKDPHVIIDRSTPKQGAPVEVKILPGQKPKFIIDTDIRKLFLKKLLMILAKLKTRLNDSTKNSKSLAINLDSGIFPQPSKILKFYLTLKKKILQNSD
jgi:hypothetical protein